MPGFEGLPDFEMNTALSDAAVERKTKFKVRREPIRFQRVTALSQVINHVVKILLNKVRKHEAVMKVRAPAHQRALVGLLPKAGDERAEQKLLGETHARVRRHFKGSQFDQAKPPAAALGRVEFVDAKFGPVRVPRHVDEQVAKNP